MNNRVKILPYVCTFLFLSIGGLFPQETGTVTQSQTVKRVAVIAFANLTRSENYTFMATSIGDNVVTSIQELKRFDVVDRQKIKATLKKARLREENGLSKEEGQNISRELGADYYILGSFSAIKDQMQVFGSIYKTADMELVGAAKIAGVIDGTVFQTLDEFAKKMAQSLDKAVPKDTVTLIKKSIPFELGVSGLGFYSLGFLKDGYPYGYGGAASLAVRNILFDKIYLGFMGGYAQFPGGKSGYESFTVIPLSGRLGYEFFLFRGFSILPYLESGMDLGQMKKTAATQSYFLFSYGGGIHLRITLGKKMFTFIEAAGHIQADEEMNPYIQAQAGLGFRI